MVETVVEDGLTVVNYVSLNKKLCKHKQSNQTIKELNEEKIFSFSPPPFWGRGWGWGWGGGSTYKCS